MHSRLFVRVAHHFFLSRPTAGMLPCFPASLYSSFILCAGYRMINADGNALELIPRNSSLEGLLNRSSLMDVQFRSMQRQHTLIYLASIDDPSAAADELSSVNMRAYAGFNMEDAGYRHFAAQNVRRRHGKGSRGGVSPAGRFYGGSTHYHVWPCSRTTIDPRIPKMPGRSTSGFHRPGGHR